ncbi:MAG: ATP-dependent Clp protease ATP-binding subunit ClpC, partial [Eubacterium sp.]|nr:ATP-dependent Clp protease ATP-binding subunit ClpC [Eubacterium sp.]
MKRNYTEEAEKALHKAAKYAAKMGSPVVGTEHLLYGLVATNGLASCVLKENELDKGAIHFGVENYCGRNGNILEEPQGEMSPKLLEILEQSDKEAALL